MIEQTVPQEPDDLTKPTSFGVGPTPLDKASQQTRIVAVLMTYCTPKLQYDGVSAWEIAGKILKVIEPPPAAEEEATGAEEDTCINCNTPFEQSAAYRQGLIDAGRGHLVRGR